MLKIGAIGSALIVPSIAYLGWRRLVSGRQAALMAVVPLMVENFYEPYAWLTLTAFVPWWILTVGTPCARARRTVLLGLIGAALFTTYYYFLFVGVLAIAVHLVIDRIVTGRWIRIHLPAVARIGAVSLFVAAPFWVPLAISVTTAPSPDSLANRWFAEHHALVPLPMLDPTIPGMLMLAGIAHLVPDRHPRRALPPPALTARRDLPLVRDRRDERSRTTHCCHSGPSRSSPPSPLAQAYAPSQPLTNTCRHTSTAETWTVSPAPSPPSSRSAPASSSSPRFTTAR